ncbi:hypothetical protein Salat_1867200 [Sesamum alatum]|uniref:Uncharacterized protein n=1 Tax=Sesamum alatum TaxID=300844 RepID=A0AAE1Y326_9LAMI|nr:hypothetical protein Salat_1867200 [Sesamum alatum]
MLQKSYYIDCLCFLLRSALLHNVKRNLCSLPLHTQSILAVATQATTIVPVQSAQKTPSNWCVCPTLLNRLGPPGSTANPPKTPCCWHVIVEIVADLERPPVALHCHRGPSLVFNLNTSIFPSLAH